MIILYEDDYFIALDKPPALTVTKAESVKEPTLEDYLYTAFDWTSHVERAGIVHRLDKDTSGVILIAKTEEVKIELQRLFHDRFVQKKYTALVHGILSGEGIIEGAIARNPKNREKFSVLEGGREATTHYSVAKNYKVDFGRFLQDRDHITKKEKAYYQLYATEYSLVECYPKTGRTHQIRVHLHHIGHPLVSDATYTNKKLYRLDATWCKRHFLHASAIEFTHPFTRQKVNITSPLPADLSQAIAYLE